MSNDFSNIGFRIEGPEDVFRVHSRNADLIRRFQNRQNSISEVLCPDENIRLWFYNHCSDAAPGYRTGKPISVTPNDWVSDPGEFPAILQVFCTKEPVLLNVDIPVPCSLERLLADPCRMDLVLFAQCIRVYQDKTDYEESGDSRMAAEAVIPCGAFSPTNDPDFVPSAKAMINGIVAAAERRTNPIDELDYCVIKIFCLGERFTIVADPEFFDKLPDAGNVIRGIYWLSGQIVD